MVFPSLHNAEARRDYEDPLFDQKQLSSHQLLVMIQSHCRLKSPGLALEEESRGNYMNLVKYTKLNVGWGMEIGDKECRMYL